VPIGFFSIFALIFGGEKKSESTPVVRIAIVDQDRSETSQRLVQGLEAEGALKVRTQESAEPSSRSLTRERAESLVRAGDVAVALVIPPGWGKSFPNWEGNGLKIDVLSDISNPIGPQVVSGLLQKVAMTAAPDLMMQGSIAQFEKYAGAMTERQRKSIEEWLPQLKSNAGPANNLTGTDPAKTSKAPKPSFNGLVATRSVDLLGEKKRNPIIAFYAAGIGVMFLLFACSAGAGALLEELEAGTLERLLTTKIGMAQLLVGKWLFLTLFGATQLVVMFLWGALLFKLDLFHHIPGFVIMTAATASTGASLSMLLAAACRSRAQLGGISTIVILSMSALGGSMIPRFMMSETLQKIGLLTFNGWALDGYQKVFWREAPLLDLWPQVLVLTFSTMVFLWLARLLARRWETV
jgi:ABC-2 type transport system permease protein